MFLRVPSKQETTQSTVGFIPEGTPGIAATLRIMRKMVKKGQESMVVRDLVIELTRPFAQKDWWREANACHEFVRDQIRYMRDPLDIELVQTPEATLRLGVGDCDDKVTLLCTMLEVAGHPTRFVAVGFQPEMFEHVYCETLIGRDWVACETTEPWEMGRSPPREIVQCKMFG